MPETILIRQPKSLAGSELGKAIRKHVEGLGYTAVYRSDRHFFDRIAVVPHAIDADGIVIDFTTGNFIAASLACAMEIELIYLDPASWPYSVRTFSTPSMPPMRITGEVETLRLDRAIARKGKLSGRSLAKPGVGAAAPIYSATIEPKRRKAAASSYRCDDLKQAHILDYM